MLRMLVVLLALSGTAPQVDRAQDIARTCDPAPQTAKKNGLRLAQQCVPGNCCGQIGCWIQCPCW